MEMEGNRGKARVGGRRKRWCLWAAAIVAVLFVVCLVLGLTVFKPRRPVTTVNSVSLSDLDVSLRGLSGVSLNVSLAINLSIRNRNRVGFAFRNSSAVLDYRGARVGDAPIPAGKISAGETLPLNLTLTVEADRLLGNSQALTDVLAGALPLSAQTVVSGKVSLLGFIRVRVVSHSTCRFTVSIANRNITDDGCAYKTSL